MFKTLHPNIRMRIVIQFLSKVVGTMVFPFMAIYFSKELSSSLAGILVMLNVVAQFIAGIYGGHLTDMLGRHRLMIAGEWLKAAGYGGMLLANSALLHSPWLTFVMMLLVSIAQGFINPAADAMLIDVSTSENRAFIYAISYWVNNLSYLIGVMIGGWFFQSHLFLLLTALCVLSLLTTWLTIKKLTETMMVLPEQTAVFSPFSVFKSYGNIAKDTRFLLFTLGGVAIMGIEYQRNNFISVRLAEEIQPFSLKLGMLGTMMFDGVKMLSLLTAVNTIIIVLFTAPIAKWLMKKSRETWLYIGVMVFAAGYAVTAIASELLILVVATIVFSCGELLYVPNRQTIMADLVDDSHRGAYVAFNGLINQAGRIIASLCLIVSPMTGNSGIAVILLLFGLLAIVLTKAAMSKKHVRSPNQDIQKLASQEQLMEEE